MNKIIGSTRLSENSLICSLKPEVLLFHMIYEGKYEVLKRNLGKGKEINILPDNLF